MKYTKPQVSILGEAASVIQTLGKFQGVQPDPITGDRNFSPAYDLDE